MVQMYIIVHFEHIVQIFFILTFINDYACKTATYGIYKVQKYEEVSRIKFRLAFKWRRA